MKALILSLLGLWLFAATACADAASEIRLYNRDEEIQLSNMLIYKNEDYYISVDDLAEINILYEYKENDDGFELCLFSKDCYGTENELLIYAVLEELNIPDSDTGSFVTGEFYSFSNYMNSKKFSQSCSSQILMTGIGNYESVVVSDGDFYVSLKTIGKAISYEYNVESDFVKLWITDSDYHVVCGNISLPEGETAPEGGIDADVMVLNGDLELTGKKTLKKVHIPQGENTAYYFVETDVTDKYNRVTVELEGNYKTVTEFVNAKYSSEFNVTAVYDEKIPFEVNVVLPYSLTACEDIYATVIFGDCAIYNSDTPVINKGEKNGTFTIGLSSDFAGLVAVTDITGDNRVFPYGYYGGSGNVLKLSADEAVAANVSDGCADINLMQCYEISGQVIPSDINSGYTVRICGVTDSEEKVYFYDEADDGFLFNIKVPSAVYEYTLHVAYKPGVYCGYAADDISNYSGQYYVFDNECDYSGIRLKYEPYLPDLPVSAKVYPEKGYIELKNLSDKLVSDALIYCAHYRAGRLVYMTSAAVDSLMVYDDYVTYKCEYPTEFYKTDEVRFFVWDNDLKPLSLSSAERVNEPYYPDEYTGFDDVEPEGRYYEAIKSMYLSGVMQGYEDGTFGIGRYVMRNEAAAMLCRMLGYWCNTYKFSCDDVGYSDWASSYVGICVNENIFELTDNKFRQYDNITVCEVLEAVLSIAGNGINADTLMYNIDTENTERSITREEFAQMLYNYGKLTEAG